MKKLRIERDESYYCKLRKLEILVDGHKKAELQQGSPIVLDIPDGAKVICGKLDWGKTKDFHLDTIEPDQSLVFQGYFTLNPLRNLGIIELPFKVFCRPTGG